MCCIHRRRFVVAALALAPRRRIHPARNARARVHARQADRVAARSRATGKAHRVTDHPGNPVHVQGRALRMKVAKEQGLDAAEVGVALPTRSSADLTWSERSKAMKRRSSLRVQRRAFSTLAGTSAPARIIASGCVHSGTPALRRPSTQMARNRSSSAHCGLSQNFSWKRAIVKAGTGCISLALAVAARAMSPSCT